MRLTLELNSHNLGRNGHNHPAPFGAMVAVNIKYLGAGMMQL